MRRLFLQIGVVLAWVIVVWGCLAVAFGGADLYTVTLGGAVPCQPAYMGDPAPTVGQSLGEIAVGAALIAFAVFCRHRIRRKMQPTAR